MPTLLTSYYTVIAIGPMRAYNNLSAVLSAKGVNCICKVKNISKKSHFLKIQSNLLHIFKCSLLILYIKIKSNASKAQTKLK